MEEFFVTPLEADAIHPGDRVADMYDHSPNDGICKGWKIFPDGLAQVQITEEHFNKLIEPHLFNRDLVSPIRNKMAYAVSTAVGIDNKISNVLVVYQYDSNYYLSMLWAR